MARRAKLQESAAGPDAEQDTRLRLLEIAETLFAREGIDKVSLRAVMLAAGTNVAAIHYHFGSKADLLREIFIRRMKPLLEDRARLLDDVLRDPSGPSVARIIEAYVRPTFEFDCSENNFGFNRLLARLSFEPRDNGFDLLRFIQADVDGRFITALQDLLPAQSRERLSLRLAFLLGMLIQAVGVRAQGFPMSDDQISSELVKCGTAAFVA